MAPRGSSRSYDYVQPNKKNAGIWLPGRSARPRQSFSHRSSSEKLSHCIDAEFIDLIALSGSKPKQQSIVCFIYI